MASLRANLSSWGVAQGLLFAALLWLAGTPPSLAESPAPSCQVAAYLQPMIEQLKSNSKDRRMTAGRTLVQSWRASLPNLIAAIATLPDSPVSRWSPSDKDYATNLTDVVRTILSSSNEAIRLFRDCHIDKSHVIKVLAWAARGEETRLRINSANILANVVDNTTICFVLDQLRDPSIDMRGRANLLAVAVAAASYAYRENVRAIEDTLNIVKKNLASNKGDLSQTEKLMAELGDRAKRSSNGTRSLPPELQQYCKGYPYRKD